MSIAEDTSTPAAAAHDNGDAPAVTEDAPPSPATRRVNPYSKPVPTSQKLGEELPVFCERCGYQLFGLSPLRCDSCDILHFHCPECAHHQPINTLRPAAQRIIGRVRGAWLVAVVFFKLMFCFWALFALGAMGQEFSYRYDYEAWQSQQAAYQQQMTTYNAQMAAYNAAVAVQANNTTGPSTMPVPPTPPTFVSPTLAPRPLHTPERVGLTILAGLFGMFARMMLLRWRRGAFVGLALAGLVAAAIVCGVAIRRQTENTILPWPWEQVFPAIFVFSSGMAFVGALIVWPIWVMLVRAFLPNRTGNALLEWQRSLSNQVSDLAREPIGVTPVSA
jgi:hypothetical protein